MQLAHSSDVDEDDDDDDEDDSDGLSPAVLRARFERQVAVNEWLVLFFYRAILENPVTYFVIFFPTLLQTKHKHMKREPKEPKNLVADYSITMWSLLYCSVV